MADIDGDGQRVACARARATVILLDKILFFFSFLLFHLGAGA